MAIYENMVVFALTNAYSFLEQTNDTNLFLTHIPNWIPSLFYAINYNILPYLIKKLFYEIELSLRIRHEVLDPY